MSVLLLVLESMKNESLLAFQSLFLRLFHWLVHVLSNFVSLVAHLEYRGVQSSLIVIAPLLRARIITFGLAILCASTAHIITFGLAILCASTARIIIFGPAIFLLL